MTRPFRVAHGAAYYGMTGKEGALTAREDQLLLAEQADGPFSDVDELRRLIAEGRERGFLTFEEVALCLEEVEVTKEQVRELHAHLLDNGVDVVAGDGRPGEAAVPEPSPREDGTREPAPKKVELDLTVE